MSEQTPTNASPAGDAQDGPAAPAMDYGAFRRMADWSAGIVDRPVVFERDEAGTLSVDAPLPGPRLRVPAFTEGKPDHVASLRMTVGRHSVDVAGHADAAFWSEAAVEKFLVPYYASLGAGRAAQVMAQLMGAWTTRVPGGVQVAALTHVRHPEHPRATGVNDTLGVVCLPGPDAAPERMPLSAFLREYRPDLLEPVLSVSNGPPPAPPALAVGHDNALVEGGYPSYLELRVMAEWSSFLRGAPAWFLFDAMRTPDPEQPYRSFVRHLEPPAETAGRIVIPAFTEPLVPGRPTPSSVVVRAQGATEGHELIQYADAIFWSTGSVEHLLMPYYASVYGGQALHEIQMMYDAWWHNRLATGSETLVYALIHLPNSDWATTHEGPVERAAHSVSGITGVLFAPRAAPGETQVLMLRDFVRRHPRP